MFDKMQFAAAAAAWCRRNGVSAESVGLTMGQDGRYALTSRFTLLGVNLEDDLPSEFYCTWDEARAYYYEIIEHGLLSDVFMYCKTHGIVKCEYEPLCPECNPVPELICVCA